MNQKELDRLQAIADGIDAMTCILSVEKLADGGCGRVRIVTGNRAYLDSVEHPAPGAELLTREFVPNCEYTRYLPRDLNFEDFSYRSAVGRKCLHSYVHPERMDIWFDLSFLPLEGNADGLYYCAYVMEMSSEPSVEHVGNVSGELASAVLETSLKLRGAGDFRACIADVVNDIRVLCGAQYGCILLMDQDRRSCRVLGESIAEGSGIVPTGFLDRDEFYPIAESWEKVIAGSNCLIVKNEQEMAVVRERDPQWYASLREAGIDTIVLFPLKNSGELLGYIWVTNFDPEKAARIKETLELTTFILGSEIANYLLLQKLRLLSTRDLLTGVNNRNRMSERIAALDSGKEGAGEPVGIVYADLNGLKYVNDTEGHEAGDELLREAADALRRVFPPSDIYRAGGDEFTMILVGVREADLAAKAAELQAVLADYPAVEFAVGYCAVEDSRWVDAAFTTADRRMYEDKRRYYEQHPEKSRRADPACEAVLPGTAEQD